MDPQNMGKICAFESEHPTAQEGIQTPFCVLSSVWESYLWCSLSFLVFFLLILLSSSFRVVSFMLSSFFFPVL